MAKFRVGDKVRIVKNAPRGDWNESMTRWLGKVMTINEIENDGNDLHPNGQRYYMQEDAGEYTNGRLNGWTWYESFIECKTGYRAGDYVRVRANLQEGYRYSESVGNGVYVASRMASSDYKGKIFRVIDCAWNHSVGYQCFVLENDNECFTWCDWMVEPVYGVVIDEMANGGVRVNRCACCGREIIDGEEMFGTVNGDYICEDCVNEHYTQCEDCGEYFHNENDNYYVTSGGEHICEGCYDNDYFTCPECGEIVHTDYSHEAPNGDYYCEDCFSEQCTYCADCGEAVWNDETYYDDDNDEYLCERCYNRRTYNEIIMGYHEFSDWELQQTGNETKYSLVPMGFELEVEKAGSNVECGKMALQCREILGNLAVYERDGSLNHGFEMITQPMTYDYWMNGANDKITETLSLLKDSGYKSHDTDTCGLHIHVGRESLATSTRSTDDVIDNIILIMETFKAELTAFSRRRSSQINRWAKFLTSETDEVSLNYVKQLKTGEDRYTALNLRKSGTIEFRIFKGSLIKETVYASLELVKNIVNIAKYEDLDGLTWNDIINYHKTVNKYLTQYNNSRGITSETKLHVLDKYQLNKELYSFKNFLDGKFAVYVESNSSSAYKGIALNGLLFFGGIRKFKTTDSWGRAMVLNSLEEILRRTNESRRIKVIDGEAHVFNEHQTDEVPIDVVLGLWTENRELLQCA